MTFLPIADRELRVHARRPATFAVRCCAAAIAFGVTTMLLMRGGGIWTSKSGDVIFRIVIGLAFVFCIYEGLRNTADCVSEEKRAGTLGLLFLTDLRGYDVVLGKLAATSLNSCYMLVAILPGVALPLLTGGVTGGEFWRAALVLAVTLIFSLSAGMFVSAISWNGRKAWMASLGLILFFTAIPPLLNLAPLIRSSVLNWASPTTALLAVRDSVYKTEARTFWTAIVGVHVLTLGLLSGAGVALPRLWQDSGQETARAVVRRRRAPVENAIARLLAEQESQKPYVWLVVIVSAAVLVTLAAHPVFARPNLAFLALAAFAAHFLLTAWVAFQACYSFHDAKASGILELLLSTPLSSREVLDGFLLGLRRIFATPVLFLLITDAGVTVIVLARIGAVDSGMISTAVVMVVGIIAWCFLGDLYSVAIYGMWNSLQAKRPMQAFTKTMLVTVILPAGVSVFCCAGVLYPVLAIIKNRIVVNSYEWPLYRDFRKMIVEA